MGNGILAREAESFCVPLELSCYWRDVEPSEGQRAACTVCMWVYACWLFTCAFNTFETNTLSKIGKCIIFHAWLSFGLAACQYACQLWSLLLLRSRHHRRLVSRANGHLGRAGVSGPTHTTISIFQRVFGCAQSTSSLTE